MPKGTKVAKKAETAVKKGTHTAKKAKVWHRTTFKRPTCLKQKRAPKNILKAVKPVITFDKYAVIKHPLSSESAIKTIEDCNTLVFIVHKKADKKMNTLITPKGEKKAYVALSADQDALDVANRIGI